MNPAESSLSTPHHPPYPRGAALLVHVAPPFVHGILSLFTPRLLTLVLLVVAWGPNNLLSVPPSTLSPSAGKYRVKRLSQRLSESPSRASVSPEPPCPSWLGVCGVWCSPSGMCRDRTRSLDSPSVRPFTMTGKLPIIRLHLLIFYFILFFQHCLSSEDFSSSEIWWIIVSSRFYFYHFLILDFFIMWLIFPCGIKCWSKQVFPQNHW